ncbi:hypothetical protein LMH73_011070 [Vibrio splendidus]|nr:hypothetical protein [Vibrio splendidus]MCC4880767.1 hypothetical protein [Vibrio splendidus]
MELIKSKFRLPVMTKSKLSKLLKRQVLLTTEQVNAYIDSKTGFCMVLTRNEVRKELFELTVRPHVQQYAVSQLTGRSPIFSIQQCSTDDEVASTVSLAVTESLKKEVHKCLSYSLVMLSETLSYKLWFNEIDNNNALSIVSAIYAEELTSVMNTIVSESLTHSEFLRRSENKYGVHPDKNDFHNVG